MQAALQQRIGSGTIYYLHQPFKSVKHTFFTEECFQTHSYLSQTCVITNWTERQVFLAGDNSLRSQITTYICVFTTPEGGGVMFV